MDTFLICALLKSRPLFLCAVSLFLVSIGGLEFTLWTAWPSSVSLDPDLEKLGVFFCLVVE